MAIRKFYTKRSKPHWKWDAKKKEFWSYGYDITLSSGKRVREGGFATPADAVAAIGRIRQAEKDKKYGFTPEAAKPRLAQLVEKRLKDIKEHKEHVRATRVLNTLVSLLGAERKVEDITTPDLKRFVDKRDSDGQAPSSIGRELNIISAMLNASPQYFPLLSQWRPPKIPRPKLSKKRRERVYTDEERETLLAYLLAPKCEDERSRSALARRRVGRKLQFALSIGLRHGEMNRVKKQDVNFSARSLKIIGTKTEYVSNPTRYIQPLTPLEMEILREFYDGSETDYVFTRSGNETPKFYRIFRRACEACGITYGRDVEGGLVFYDARHDATTRLIEAGITPATVQEQMGWADRSMVLYYSHATPRSRAQSADARASINSPKPSVEQPPLTPELIEALSSLMIEGRLGSLTFARIIRGEEKIPDELLELLMPEATRATGS